MTNANKRKLFLIDGHSHLYKAYHALGPLSTSRGEPTGAVYGFMQTFHRIRREYSPSHIAVVLDPAGPTFRSDIYAEYKANRPPAPPDLKQQLQTLKELLKLMEVPVFEVAPYEADDVIGTLALWAVQSGGEACIVSADKDLLQCVQKGVTVLREHLGKIEVLDEQGVFDKMGVWPRQLPAYLGLLGDTSDNIPGVPGIGKKRAAELLTEFESLEKIIEASTGKTKPKYWTNIADNADAARKSLELATVVCNVSLKADWEQLRWEYNPSPELRELFIRLEFKQYVQEIGGTPVEERTTNYKTVSTEAGLREAAEMIREAGLASIDTETTGFDPFSSELVGISISWENNQAIYIPVGDEHEKREFLKLDQIQAVLNELLSGSGVSWVAHNWRFDFKMMQAAGFTVENIAFDTLLAAYLVNPDRTGYSLKDLAVQCLGIQMTEIRELIGDGDDMLNMAAADVERVSNYACQDADVTLQLFHCFAPQIQEAALAKVLDEIEMPLVPVLARMELEGVSIDRDYFAKLSTEIKARLDELATEIYSIAGREFNINSPKQLAVILFDELCLPTQKKTATGYSTDVTVLEQLSRHHPLPAKLLEFRQLEKLRGTYIDSLPTLVNWSTGRIHTRFNQTVAATGRLSSSEPNLQNIPVRREEGRKIRRGFISRGIGWKLLAADYSQIELRILAHISGDEALTEAFRTNEDIHTLTASKVYRLKKEDVTKEMRNSAKAINFGIIYGMSAFRLSRDLDIPRKTAESFIDEYFNAYKGVRRYIDTTLEECRRTGYVTTLVGRKRLVGDVNASKRDVRGQAERIAVNMPIQGTCADMIKIAMIRIDERMRQQGLRSRMILQVHDELIFDVPEDELDQMKILVPEEMKAALPLSVPVQVDLAAGDNWAEI